MILALMDGNFNIIKYISYTNLQWIRRYYEPGEFSVTIPSSEYDNQALYLFTPDRPEVGIIQKLEYEDSYDGDEIQLSGYFYEYKLNDKITFPRFTGSGTPEEIARSIVETYKDDIPLLQLGDANDPTLGESTAKQSTGDGLATVLYELLQSQELSYRCVYDYEANTMTFEVWQGLDRTQSQSANPFVTFSSGFRNIQNESITLDHSNYKNYGVVIGNGDYEDGNQIEVDVDLRESTDDYIQYLYIDETSEKYDSEEQTLAEYKEILYQAGLEKLADYVNVTNVEFETVDRGLTYLTDYDLGDKCDVVIDAIGEAYTVRITEITETFKEGKHSITLTFGDKVPRVYYNI